MSDSNLRDGSGNPITSTASAIDVNIKSGGAGGGGTQYADGTTQATPTGTAILGKNPSNVLKTVSLDASGNVNVNLAAGSISGGNAAASPTAAAVPASADYTGFNSGGNLVGVSAANPLPTSLASLPALVAGSAVIGHVINDASSAVIGHVINDSGSTTAVTGNVTAVQPTGTNLHVVVDSAPSTPVTNAGTFATQSTLAAETTKVIGTVNVAAAQTIAVTNATAANLKVDLSGTAANATAIKTDGSAVTQPVSVAAAVTVAQATAASLNATVVQATPASLQATVTPIALTKATQGATGFSTQDLKDAGRSARTIFLDSFAVAATAETLMTMSYSSDNAAVTTGTSYAVTAAKRLRIQSINVGLHTITGNTTAVNIIVRLRVNNGGAALVSSPIQMVIPVQGIAAANQAGIPVDITIPDGWEFVAGAGIGVTVACAGFVTTTAAPKVDISIVGYEY